MVGDLAPSRRCFYSCWSSRDAIGVGETHVELEGSWTEACGEASVGYRMDMVCCCIGDRVTAGFKSNKAICYMISTGVAKEEDMDMQASGKCKAKTTRCKKGEGGMGHMGHAWDAIGWEGIRGCGLRSGSHLMRGPFYSLHPLATKTW